MLSVLKNIDKDFFLLLNSLHADWLDPIMLAISHKLIWIPFYILLFYLLSQKLKYNWRKIAFVCVSIALAITLSDQFSVHAFKNVFMRYRPCHNSELAPLVHVVGNCGGTYGFVSSHAANTFALATILILYFKSISASSRPLRIVLIGWAILVSYSRIYCGVHYPLDIIGGALIGVGIGISVFLVSKRVVLN